MNLKYSDEQDKCYGVTGMAVSLVIWDADDMLAHIDMDADESVEFVPEYYFSGNRSVFHPLKSHPQSYCKYLSGN